MPPKLTIASTCKPFRGPERVNQLNAIRSWTKLPGVEVMLLGDDEGTEATCKELGLRFVPEVARAPRGAPLVSSLLEVVQREARAETVCYANCDMVLTASLPEAAERARRRFGRFFLVGRRRDVFLDHEFDFEALGWEERLRALAAQGTLAPPPGNSDYFVFPRGLFREVPPMVVGRGYWEAWLVYKARALGVPVVDASEAVDALHQQHHHFSNNATHDIGTWRAALAENMRLAGEEQARFNLWDATHRMTHDRVVRARGLRPLMRAVETLPILHPGWGPLARLPRAAIDVVRGAVHLRRNQRPTLDWVVRQRLPPTGVVGILGIAERDDGSDLRTSAGFRLGYQLSRGGYPVVVYDPAHMQRARTELFGTVVFTQDLQECLRRSDVLVVAAGRPDLRLDLAQVRKGTVIDLAGALESDRLPAGVDYVRFDSGKDGSA